jgi:hypothetical protein
MFHKLLRLLTPYWLIGVTTWAGMMLLHWFATKPAAMSLPLITLAAAGAVSKSKVARVAGGAVVWGVVLQAALVMAVVNGLRRQWNVWTV